MIAQESRSEPQTVERSAVGERHRLGVAGSCWGDRLATSGTVGAKEGRKLLTWPDNNSNLVAVSASEHNSFGSVSMPDMKRLRRRLTS
jgi:hypothetical protein